jgi:hypothetical protein
MQIHFMSRIRKEFVWLIAALILVLLCWIMYRFWIAPATVGTSQSEPVSGLRGVCLNYLRLIDAAKRQWAEEYHKTTKDPAPTWADLRPYIEQGSNGPLPACPAGGIYTIGRLDQPATCSLRAEEHIYERTSVLEK